jgi:NAD(P)-dependent dehydrogenase (short-subunit alcohol dehydrogenase family)
VIGGDPFGLDGKVAVVTGGGAREGPIGNGAAAAVLLARAGATVAVLDLDERHAERTYELIDGEGGSAFTLNCDVADEDECEKAVEYVTSRAGPPDVLVNNVGLAGPPGTAVDVDLRRWEEGMRLNLQSMVMMSRFAIPGMVGAGGGSIVNVSSVGGLRGGHPALLYATSKGAIIPLTQAMAAQHGPEGVRVNCVAPGLAYTGMVESRGLAGEMREARRAASPLGTEGTGWDVGAAVLFLAGAMAGWITGVVLPVDGGYSAFQTLPTPPRI